MIDKVSDKTVDKSAKPTAKPAAKPTTTLVDKLAVNLANPATKPAVDLTDKAAEDSAIKSTDPVPIPDLADQAANPTIIKMVLDSLGIKTNEDTDPVKAADSIRHEDSPLEVPDGEIIPVEGPGAMAYADELAFMAEKVEVLIMDSSNVNDTTRLVPIGVNGKTYNLLRGKWTSVPRFVLEILAKTKREAWSFSYKKNGDGSTSDTNQMHRILRYPHQFKDKNPNGMKWYDSIKDRHM